MKLVDKDTNNPMEEKKSATIFTYKDDDDGDDDDDDFDQAEMVLNNKCRILNKKADKKSRSLPNPTKPSVALSASINVF